MEWFLEQNLKLPTYDLMAGVHCVFDGSPVWQNPTLDIA